MASFPKDKTGKKQFSYNIFHNGNDILLAIADTSVLGKRFEHDELCIEISKDFYGKKTCDSAQAYRLIKSATIVNAVGKGIIALMLKEKMIEKNMILTIKGVPHAQIISVQ